jgi:hypothetical protein
LRIVRDPGSGTIAQLTTSPNPPSQRLPLPRADVAFDPFEDLGW